MLAHDWPTMAGYALLGLFYAVAGVQHFRHFAALTGALASRRIPFPAATLALGSILQIVAGGLLALRMHVFSAALGLAAFTLLASLMMLDVWRASGAAREAGIRAWQSNLALIGALLVIGTQ